MPTSDFTLSDVLAWARTKPADERYDFTQATQCAVAQFGMDTGRPHLVGLLSRELAMLVGCKPFHAFCAVEDDATFGKLVERLEVLLPAEPLTDTWTKAATYLTDIKALDREVA